MEQLGMQQSEMAWRKCLLLAKFKAAVCMFLFGFLIALCMPDGYNRTGYVICCYLVEQLGLTAEQALAEVIVCVCVCLCVCVYGVNKPPSSSPNPLPCCFFPPPNPFSFPPCLHQFAARRPPGIKHPHFRDALLAKYRDTRGRDAARTRFVAGDDARCCPRTD